jgi:hypothetical protein
MFDLNRCDKACTGCIKGYKKKHKLVQGDSFKISCNGIPQDYISKDLSVSLPKEQLQTALAVLDPVMWAATNLDWHCMDPDGEIWKRKNPEEYYDFVSRNPGVSLYGNSRYHRPYQAEMLRCTSKRKVFRIGRQAGKSESLCVSMLYNLFTKPGKSEDQDFVIILITPYQTQIELIFTRLHELIKMNPDLQNSIKRTVKAPNYTLELHNGSIIRGFTAGSKSGGNADSVRGQHGDMLVFDEADYLADEDMNSAMAIITNSPQATVWMSSTPTGKREGFWKRCQSNLFREFHYPSNVNPLWNAEKEATFRESLTDIGYTHEILAEFGEQEQGVFQNVYVQAAKAPYTYGSMAWNHMWTYTIGVDWNDTKNGTTIAVVGFNPNSNHFYLVDRHIVSREGWTQIASCEKVAELNRIWKPAAIYIDKGFGGTQHEIIRKYGYDSLRDPRKGPSHPDSRLKDVVHQYDFGSKIEIHDLWTKEPIQKAAKPFLVENTVRRFETKTFSFAETDKVMEAQLNNYIIDRVTQTGNPVFAPRDETIGDHTLDAVMLALVGFTLTKTPLGAPAFSTGIQFSGQFGERTEADVGQGELIVNTGKKVDAKEAHRPQTDRTNGIVQERRVITTPNQVPANHVSRQSGMVKPWRWDGFARDEDKPKVRSLSEAFREAEVRTGHRTSRSSLPPRRKNI